VSKLAFTSNSSKQRDTDGMPGHDFAEYVVSEITKANPSEMIIAGGVSRACLTPTLLTWRRQLSWNFKWVFP
jgi:hypothetical protein